MIKPRIDCRGILGVDSGRPPSGRHLMRAEKLVPAFAVVLSAALTCMMGCEPEGAGTVTRPADVTRANESLGRPFGNPPSGVAKKSMAKSKSPVVQPPNPRL